MRILVLVAAACACVFAQDAEKAKPKPGKFDFYVLSLSWSPQFCAGRNMGPNDPQCGTGRSFGFVLHGLWPQYEPKGWPQDCATGGGVTKPVVDSMMDIMPSEKLIQHEWSKHGTCSGLDVKGYFADSRKAFESVKVPAEFQGPNAEVNVAPGEFKKRLVGANSGLSAESVAILCGGRYLSEVRVCLGKDLKPRPCPSGVRDQCRTAEMIVRPVR